VVSNIRATLGSQLCKGYQVRDMQLKYNAQTALIVAGAGGTTFQWRDETSSVNDFCSICYAHYLQYISNMRTASLTSHCVPQPDRTCLSSSVTVNAGNWFASCSGYQISFTGPLCSQTYVDRVEKYLPYYVITQCMINFEYCQLMSLVFEKISLDTDMTCLKCYEEYTASLSKITSLNPPLDLHACGKDQYSVWSNECKHVIADSLADFTVCAGRSMNSAKVDIQSLQTLLAAVVSPSITSSTTTDAPSTSSMGSPDTSRGAVVITYELMLGIFMLMHF
jgi:hypothetical protein